MKAMTRQSRRGLAMFLALAFLLSAALVLAPRAEAIPTPTVGTFGTPVPGIPYSAQVSSTNNPVTDGPITYSVTAGALPSWAFLNPGSGAITGTPPASDAGASYSFAIAATDTTGTGASGSFGFTVANIQPLGITNLQLQNGIVGDNYADVIVGVGGVPPYTISQNGLPSGLTLQGNGQIIGTPLVAGNFTVNIIISDSASNSITVPLSLSIGGALYLTPGTPPTGTVGSSYSFRPTVIGGSASTRFELLSSLAPGLGFDTATGTISGTPTGTFDADVTIRAVDGAATSTQSYRIKINPSGGSTGGYKITTGDGSRYVGGSSLSFTANIPVSRFQALKVNGNTLSTSNYSYSGTTTSTTATLNKAYLDSLASGSRSISFVASDGSASGSFSVGSEPNYRPPTYPSYPSTPGRYPTVVGNTGGGGKAPTVIMKVEVEEASIEWKVVD